MDQVRLLLAGAALLCVSAAQAPGPSIARDTPASTLDGVFTAAQASRGERQFAQFCSSCHAANEHTGRRFETRWQDATLGDVVDQLKATMPENEPGSLEPEAYANIVAFLLRATGYPAGAHELPSDAAALSAIRVLPLPR